jgi:thiamine-phosphate pyrophosphorylase
MAEAENKPVETSLYFITDDRRSMGRSAEETLAAAVAGGVKLAQYRPAGVSDAEFLRAAREMAAVAASAGCALLLNDRADIALASGAAGVHLGRNDIPISDARRILGPLAIIGYSAHDPEEAAAAQRASADFITYSPIFPTTSHSLPRPAVGARGLRDIIDSARLTIPVFALGGVGLEQINELKAAGIRRAAVVTAITEQPDMTLAASRLIAALDD